MPTKRKATTPSPKTVRRVMRFSSRAIKRMHYTSVRRRMRLCFAGGHNKLYQAGPRPPCTRPIMHEPPTQHLASRTQQDVLVVTINEPQLHSDVLVDAVGHELVLAVVHAKIRQVALDLHNVNVLTSIGIRPLLGFHRYLNQVGGKLVLCGLTKPVV